MEKVIAQCDCGKLYKLPEKYCGKSVRCKKCGDAFDVPSLEESLAESGLEEDFDPGHSEEPKKKRKKDKKKRSKKATGKHRRRAPAEDEEEEEEEEEEKPKKDKKKRSKKATGKHRRRAPAEDEEEEEEEEEEEKPKKDKKKRSKKATGKHKRRAPAEDEEDEEEEEKPKKDKKDKKRSKATGKHKRRPAADEEEEEPASKKKKAAKKKSGGTGKLKRRDSDDGEGKGRKGSGTRKRKGSGKIQRTSRSGSRSGSRDGDDSADRARGRVRGKKKTDPRLLYGGIGGVVLLLVVVLVFAMKPGGPSKTQLGWYDEIIDTVVQAEGYRKLGNFKEALELYEGAINAAEKNPKKLPGDPPERPKFASSVETAKAQIEPMKQLFELYKKVGQGGSYDELIAMSRSADVSKRRAALIMIKPRIDKHPGFMEVVARLAQDPTEDIAEGAKQALIATGGPESAPYLTERLSLPEGSGARDKAIETLVGIAHPAAQSGLIKILGILDPKKNPGDVSLAEKAVQSLGEIGKKASVGPLTTFKGKCGGELAEQVQAVIDSCKDGD